MIYYCCSILCGLERLRRSERTLAGVEMNYNKLWKLLIDKKLRKKDLREMAGLSTNVIAKMGKGGDVSTQALRKICEALDCKLEDVVELDPKKE